MTQQPSGTASTAVKVKGHFAYGFTLLPNILRDQLMPLAGTDAFAFAYLILSWAAEGERGAKLSARYTKDTTGWSAGRLQAAKTDLLKAWPTVFSMTPGNPKLSLPETWWVDMSVLAQMHASFLLEQSEKAKVKRGPGRPKKPVPGTDTGFPKLIENPVPGINTGFSPILADFGKNLFRKSEHPCSGNRNTPVPGTDTHKDIAKTSPKERGGALDVTGNAHAQGHSPSAPVVESNPAQHSSGDAALQTSTHEAGPAIPSPVDLPLPQVPSSQSETLEQPAPDGVAADAAGDVLTLTDEDAEFLFGSGTSTEALEKVPGGGAAGEAAAEAPRGDAAPAVALTVAELAPIPPTDLASRLLAAPESEVFKALREILGNQMPTYISEHTRTGNISRELWLKLTPAEIRQVIVTARLEIVSSKASLITVVVRGLDRLIGAVKPPKVVVPAPAGEKVLGPVDLSHLDPQLPEGARCSVSGKLGVVKSVRQNGYIVELDGGNMITLDRCTAAHLNSLKSSTEPLTAPVTSADEVVVLAKVGTMYREVATGAEVRVTAVQGATRVLSSGRSIPFYELLKPHRFEPLSA